MQGFGYCIWLMPEENSELYNFTKGFNPHISLSTKNERLEGINKFLSLKKKSVKIKILENPIVTIDDDFNALQFNVKILNEELQLNPTDSHISFIYRYNDNIKLVEVIELVYSIDFNKTYIFENYKLMYCNGHYKKWKELLDM